VTYRRFLLSAICATALVSQATACDKKPSRQWCGVETDESSRIEYCFERLATCEEKHGIEEEGGPMTCRAYTEVWCDEKRFECYPTEELCDKGVRETRKYPRESHSFLTGEVTHIPAAKPGDKMPECKPAWPLKLIGMPD